MTAEARPDFIIIGAMKCATSTLHEQLAAQPGFFMSTPKEPNFFSNDEIYARGLDWYRGLFRDAPGGALRGESSTHYSKLPTYPQTIERLQDFLGGRPVRLIYLMRHPVDRLISHYIHEWSQGVVAKDCPLDEAIHRHPEMVAYSCYHRQLAPWREAFGEANILPLFFDGLKAHPQATLERCAQFLRHDGAVQWVHDQAPQNVSSQRMRKSPLRDRVAAFPPLRYLRRRLIPSAWRERVKRRWMMTERPELGATARREVEAVFDQDLAALGAELGLDLSCASWKAVTADATARWRR